MICNSSVYSKSASIRAVSGLSCGASILGSFLIIISYICFKRLRTKVREILLHLSVADFGVALANLLGLVVYYDRFYKVECDDDGSVYRIESPRYIRILCEMQAFFALYFTLSSILWTISLAVYLYFILVHFGTFKARYFSIFAYFFCYGMPLLLSLWPLLTNRLGYSPYNSAGWCSVILVNPLYPQKREIFMGIIGYDMWIYLALVMVTILYFAMKSFFREELKRTKEYLPRNKFWKAVDILEYKFLSIPVAFLLLRVWSCVINLLVVYIGTTSLPLPLVYLSGVGDSGQGFVNAILFVLLTKEVRSSFSTLFCCRRCRSSGKCCGASSNRPPLVASNYSERRRAIQSASRGKNSNSRSGMITPEASLELSPGSINRIIV